MSKYTWILSPGHEGLSPTGIYMREGKQSPQVPPGIYEGVFNRTICAWIEARCTAAGIECIDLNPGPINIPLDVRVEYANELHERLGNCRYLAIHANADGHGKWTKANGCVVFHVQKSVLGKELATAVHNSIVESTPIGPRGLKTSRFTELVKTAMPAAYIECGFMTNKLEAEYMASREGQEAISEAIFEAIRQIESE